MNARILSLLAVLTLASGCIIHNDNSGGGGGYYGSYGDVTFSWTFGGQTCQQASDVASVVVDIPGQVLQPNSFSCETNGYPGITLTNFAPGGYSYTVTAYDSRGTALYTQGGTFNVDGNVTVNVDLAPTANANSYAYLSWDFAAPSRNSQNAPVCVTNQGGEIPAVRVTIDGAASYYNCADGWGSNAVKTAYLPSGQHNIEIAAVNPGSTPAQDYVFAVANSTLNTVAGSPAAQSYTLGWTVGGAAVDWAFYSKDGSTNYPTCATAGVTTLRVNFYDTVSKTYLYPYPNGDVFTCPTDGSNYQLYNALPAGQYQVTIDAYNDAGTIVYSDASPLPQVTIQAGAFAASANAPNPATPLYLQ